MAKYEVNHKIYEIRKEVENAIFKRYFEKRFFSTSIIACLLIGFLLGLLANQGVRMTRNEEQEIREEIATQIEAVEIKELNGLGMKIIAAEIARGVR
jgi:uncharacterized membrane protein (DUF441 family)